MKVKIKIIEFSSDIFSKSSQLKDIQISPLFSNISFSINIFDAISKNEEYEIKANTPNIKIGLYQGKSLLGIGEIDINKKSQKIKIASQQNKNQNSLFLNNSNYNKDNDYYIILECINSNKDYEKLKPSNLKDNKHKKRKNASVDSRIYSSSNKNHNHNNNKNKQNKKMNNPLKDYFSKYNEDKKPNFKNSGVTEENRLIKKNKEKNNNTVSNFDMTSKSSILKKGKNKLMNNVYDSNSKSNENESKEFYFNESFQKENFSDGVLILNDKENTSNENLDINIDSFPKLENIEINNFNNLIHDFNLIYNNVNNNNSMSLDNIKDNFLLEYQYFLEKTSDIFNIYLNLSTKLHEQNTNIQKYIQNLNNKIKALYKKNTILKLKSQSIDMNEINKNYFQEDKKYYNYEIKGINNKLSLVKYMSNDIFYLTQNLNQNNKSSLKKIFDSIIKNEKIIKIIKKDENFIKFLIKNRQKIRISLDNENITNTNRNNIKIDENISDEEEEEYENEIDNENDNEIENEEENKIDIETLKNKIDKLKCQYLNETIPKEQKNKKSLYENKKKKVKEIKTSGRPNMHCSYNRSAKNLYDLKKNKRENSSVTEMYDEYRNNRYTNYYNVFTPNNNKRNRLIKHDF